MSVLHDNAENRQPRERVDDNSGRSKTASRLCQSITELIVSMGWPEGASLGSESELIAQYGVSRSVFRESVRLLEHDGIAVMRKGKGGGLTIIRPDESGAVHAMALSLEHRGVTVSQLMQARSVIELAAVQLAAENVDEGQIETLREYMKHESEFVAEDIYTRGHEFHVRLAQMTGNPAIELMVRCLLQLTARYSKAVESSDRAVTLVHSRHAPIADAVVAGDVALARHRMMREFEEMVLNLRDE